MMQVRECPFCVCKITLNIPKFGSIIFKFQSLRVVLEPGGQYCQGQVGPISFGNEELIKSGSSSSSIGDIGIMNWRMEKGSSRWQRKGKRNARNVSKNKRQVTRNSMDVDMDEESNSFAPKVDIDHRTIVESQIGKYRGWNGNLSREVSPRLFPYCHSHFTMNPNCDCPIRNYEGDSALYEVNLEVNASYRPQHVPYISLVSKLTGLPIIGHPLTVELLNDGFCDNLMSGPECSMSTSCSELDEFLEDDDTYYELKPKMVGGGRIRVKQSTSLSKSNKSGKNGALSNKKIRKLSSLTRPHKQSNEEKKPLIIKIKSPSLACVPLIVVFSRINASFNGSMQQAHHAK